MSIYTSIGGEEPSFLSSNLGWSEFCDWADSLPPAAVEVVHLAEHGWSQNIDALAEQLRAAGNATSPEADVAATIRSLLDAIDARAPESESVVITDGLSADDEGDDTDDEDSPNAPENPQFSIDEEPPKDKLAAKVIEPSAVLVGDIRRRLDMLLKKKTSIAQP